MGLYMRTHLRFEYLYRLSNTVTLDNAMYWKIKPAEPANTDWRNEILMTSAE